MTASRERTPKRVRFEVLRRDDHTCRYCGRSAPEVALEVDHVIPVALGGRTEPSNLVTACADCNRGKASSSPSDTIVADVDTTAARWVDAMEQAAAEARADREMRSLLIDRWHDTWAEWTCNATGDQVPLPTEWRTSIGTFLDTGIDLALLIDLVPAAMNSTAHVDNKFSYFAGCAWNQIRALQARARTILDTPTILEDAPDFDTDFDTGFELGQREGLAEGYRDGFQDGLTAGRAEATKTGPSGLIALGEVVASTPALAGRS